jgi:drug/metabolite transporter (DMT)-like permease
MDESLEKYRAHLIAAEQKAQEDFDKTLISLSGGALGVSFVFLKDFLGKGPITYKGLLLSAWLCWGVSVISVLFSFFASNLALRRAITQVDAEKMYEEHVGGRFDTLTAVLNVIGGILFFSGVILIAVFVWNNLEAVNVGPK